MRTTFVERGGHTPKADLRRLLAQAVDIVAPHLDMGDGPEWNIQLEFHSDLSKIVGTAMGEVMGATLGEPNEETRTITVALRMGSRFVVLQALAHEMVHVAQVARGDLRSSPDEPGTIRWKGTRQNISHPLAKLLIMIKGYENLPWEVEAFGRMDELLLKILDGLSAEDRLRVIRSTRT